MGSSRSMVISFSWLKRLGRFLIPQKQSVARLACAQENNCTKSATIINEFDNVVLMVDGCSYSRYIGDDAFHVGHSNAASCAARA